MSSSRVAPPSDRLLQSRYALADDVEPDVAQDAVSVASDGRRLSADIEGVVYSRAVSHVDHRGSLTEAANLSDPFWDEPIVYAYCVTIAPGRIKGWGMHRLQADRYFHAAGSIRVVLYDGRRRSPTHGCFAQFHLTDAARARLLIPPGVWHADQNWGDSEAVLMNFPTRPFDHANPDKYRVSPGSGAIPFDFSLTDG
ncbi:MAG: dTDP-4-dehydrorhamnose 3,5-epimerase family protein [Actinobacteria bacterium]|nr:dTDP-4-dehydrorhamnose 3,5-epimerase family protein [Actinomycetota bacterium]